MASLNPADAWRDGFAYQLRIVGEQPGSQFPDGVGKEIKFRARIQRDGNHLVRVMDAGYGYKTAVRFNAKAGEEVTFGITFHGRGGYKVAVDAVDPTLGPQHGSKGGAVVEVQIGTRSSREGPLTNLSGDVTITTPPQSGTVNASSQPDGQVVVEESDPEPEDFAGIVNADNESGAALAPSLRRRGIEVDDVGTTASVQGEEFKIVDEGEVRIGDETIQVGDITDSDEVARVIDGPNAGDPIQTDADVAPDSSSGGSGGGLVGVVGIGLLALLAGGAALLGGDS